MNLTIRRGFLDACRSGDEPCQFCRSLRATLIVRSCIACEGRDPHCREHRGGGE